MKIKCKNPECKKKVILNKSNKNRKKFCSPLCCRTYYDGIGRKRNRPQWVSEDILAANSLKMSRNGNISDMGGEGLLNTSFPSSPEFLISQLYEEIAYKDKMILELLEKIKKKSVVIKK